MILRRVNDERSSSSVEANHIPASDSMRRLILLHVLWVRVCLPVCVHRMGFIAWEHIWGDISFYFSHDRVCHHLPLNAIRICMIPLSVFDIWGGFMDPQSRIYYPIASLWLCQTFSTWETLSSSGSSSGLRSRLKMAEGSFPLPKLQGTDWQA